MLVNKSQHYERFCFANHILGVSCASKLIQSFEKHCFSHYYLGWALMIWAKK